MHNSNLTTFTVLALSLCACSRTVSVQNEPHTNASVAAPAQLGWTSHAEMPVDLQEMAGAAVNGKIYIVAGITNGVNTTIASTEVYDVASDTWTNGPALPEPRHHPWAAALDGKLYVIGGYSSLERPWPAHNTNFVLDPKTNVWTSKRPMPTSRGALAVVAYKGKLYAIGGAIPREQLTTVEIYDPKTDAWTTGAPMPTAREHISAEVIGDHIYVVAGRAPKPGDINNFATLEAYTPATNTWRAVATMSPARTGAVAAVVNNKLYLIGGDGAPNSNAGKLTQSFGAIR